MKKVVIAVILGLLSCGYGLARAKEAPSGLIFFFSPGCRMCQEAKNSVIPEIEKEFKGRINLEYRDISDVENYKLLLGLKQVYEPNLTIELPVFYFRGHFLNSQGRLQANLRAFIIKYLPRQESVNPARLDLVAHFKSFTPLAIISAGLVDGINPCAFTVIVFFISFLALQGYRKRGLIAIGLAFIFSVFITYCLIGLGLFGFLYKLKSFWLIPKILNLAIGIFSIALGGAAVYDLYKFKKTGATDELILQLPQAIKNRIHALVASYYRNTKDKQTGQTKKRGVAGLLLSALVTGFLVSLLEAVCTGQMYLPTLAFILKTTPLKLIAAGYLLVYNLMFILPLMVIFLFALLGVTSQQFSRFLKDNLSAVKIAMAIMFFGLGVFLIWKA